MNIKLFCIGVFIFLFVALFFAIKDDGRLMDECIRDGKKEYECVSMLRRNTHVVYPVIVK